MTVKIRGLHVFHKLKAKSTLTITSGNLAINSGNLELGGSVANTLTIASGNLAVSSGDFSFSGHKNTQTFVVNAFNCPLPGTDWTPLITGAQLADALSAKKMWIPLNFAKIGDEIVSYKLVGDIALGSGTHTLDCKLVKVNKADPLTTTDVASGAIVQLTANGNFDSAATLNAVEVVATDKAYLLEIAGTTASGSIYVTHAEVLVNRK